MDGYEPADKILEHARSRADVIIKEAKDTSARIKADNKKAIDERLAAAKEALTKEIENQNLAKYAKLRIEYDKAVQNAISEKRTEVIDALIKKLINDDKYKSALNSTLREKTHEQQGFKVYANLDINLLGQEFSPQKTNSINHGFIIDFGQKSYILDTERLIKEYLRNHPLTL